MQIAYFSAALYSKDSATRKKTRNLLILNKKYKTVRFVSLFLILKTVWFYVQPTI